MLDIQATKTPESTVAQAVSEYISSRAGAPTLLMIAGGSLPETVLPHIDQRILTPQLTISIFDERCTEDESGLNELQLQATPFYDAAKVAGAQFLDVVVGDQGSCPMVAADWESRMREWQGQHPDGEIVVLAGVGADGHIAGILCHTPEETPIFTSKEWIVAHHFVATDNPYPYRITPTFTFWQKVVATSFIYMSGTEKAAALKAIQADDGNLATTPGRVLNTLSGSVVLFTDSVEG